MLPFPPLGDLPNPGRELASFALKVYSLLLNQWGNVCYQTAKLKKYNFLFFFFFVLNLSCTIDFYLSSSYFYLTGLKLDILMSDKCLSFQLTFSWNLAKGFIQTSKVHFYGFNCNHLLFFACNTISYIYFGFHFLYYDILINFVFSVVVFCLFIPFTFLALNWH